MEIHTETHYNHTFEIQRVQQKNIERRKREETHHIKWSSNIIQQISHQKLEARW